MKRTILPDKVVFSSLSQGTNIKKSGWVYGVGVRTSILDIAPEEAVRRQQSGEEIIFLHDKERKAGCSGHISMLN